MIRNTPQDHIKKKLLKTVVFTILYDNNNNNTNAFIFTLIIHLITSSSRGLNPSFINHTKITTTKISRNKYLQKVH